MEGVGSISSEKTCQQNKILTNDSEDRGKSHPPLLPQAKHRVSAQFVGRCRHHLSRLCVSDIAAPQFFFLKKPVLTRAHTHTPTLSPTFPTQPYTRTALRFPAKQCSAIAPLPTTVHRRLLRPGLTAPLSARPRLLSRRAAARGARAYRKRLRVSRVGRNRQTKRHREGRGEERLTFLTWKCG